jgi:hypothetical protein
MNREAVAASIRVVVLSAQVYVRVRTSSANVPVVLFGHISAYPL